MRRVGKQISQGLRLFLFGRFTCCFYGLFLGCIGSGLFLRIFGGFLLRLVCYGLFLGVFSCFFLRIFSRFFLGVFRGLFLGLFFRSLLGLFLGFFLGYVSQFFLFGFFGFSGLFGIIGFLGFISLLRLVCLFGLARFGFVSLLGFCSFFGSLFFLLFRSFYSFLLNLLLFHLLDFGLARGGFLRLTRNLLIGLGGRLTFGLELVQGRLNNRFGRRQFRSHGKADKQHAKNQDVQPYRPDCRPKIVFRGGRLPLFAHQGASVIKPTLPTPAFCRPPMAPMTAP